MMGGSGDERVQVPSEPESTGSDLALIGAAASVLLSWYEFYLRENAFNGLFIALWPPTILAFASYLKQRSMEERFEQSLAGSTAQTLRGLLE